MTATVTYLESLKSTKMSRFYLAIILFILFISCKKEHEGLILTMDNDSISPNAYCSFSIKNNSSHKIALLTDFSRYNYYYPNSSFKDENVGLSLIIEDKNDSVIHLDRRNILFNFNKNKTLETYISRIEEERKNYLNKYKHLLITDNEKLGDFAHIKQNAVIISPNSTSSRNLKIISPNTQESYMILSYYGFKIDPEKSYFARLRVQIDSSRIKKLAPRFFLDSLSKNNIHLFNGVLISNKIPIKLKSN